MYRARKAAQGAPKTGTFSSCVREALADASLLSPVRVSSNRRGCMYSLPKASASALSAANSGPHLRRRPCGDTLPQRRSHATRSSGLPQPAPERDQSCRLRQVVIAMITPSPSRAACCRNVRDHICSSELLLGSEDRERPATALRVRWTRSAPHPGRR
jgi:hypothetical protein